MSIRWWNVWMLMFCLALPVSVSTGCGDAHMSQDEAEALEAENEELEDEEGEDPSETGGGDEGGEGEEEEGQ